MKRCIFVSFLSIVISTPLLAQQPGVFIVEETVSTPQEDLPGTADTTRIYLTDNCLRRDEGGKSQTTIVRLDIQKIWMIHHKSQTYSELTSEMFQGLGVMGLMMFGMKIDSLTGLPIIPEPLFKKTGSIRKIGKYNCFELVLNKKEAAGLIQGLLGSMVLWVSSETGLEKKTYGTIMRRMLGNLGQPYDSFFHQLEDIGGYPVLVKYRIMGQDVEQRLLDSKKIEMGPSIFKIPDGYQKEEKLFRD